MDIDMGKLLCMIVFVFLEPCMTSALDGDLPPLPSMVYSTPRPFGCGQRDRCARRPDDLPFHATNCFCDDLCEVYGDCCKDYSKTSRRKIKLAKNTVSCERRPQIYPEGEVYIVKSCPKDYSDSFVQEKCEDERASGEFLQLPVTGTETRVLYRNVYCAICAGDTNVTFWTVKINCNNKPSRYDDTRVAHSLLASPHCVLEYNHPIDLPYRNCKSHFSKCDRNFDGDKRVEKKCKSYTSFVYASLHVFKNKHCAMCNHVNETYLSCEDTRTPMPPMEGDPIGYTPPFSVTLDINQGHGRIAESRVGMGGTSSVVETNIVLRGCSESQVFNPFQEDCVVIGCPQGSEFIEGDCSIEGTREDVMTEASSPRITTDELTVTELVSSSSLYMESTSVVASIQPTTPMHVTRRIPNIVTEPSTPKIFEDMDCPLMKLNSSDYYYLHNGSIYVMYAKRTYNPGQFITIGRNHFICLPSSDQTTRRPTPNTTSSVQMFKFTMVQSLISLIGLVVSLSALLVVFIVYTMFPPLRDLPGMCLMSLIASLFVAQCLFLFGTPRTELPDVCLTLGALMHYFFLAAFLWVNVLAIDICRTFASSGHQSDASCVRFSAYSFYAWTLPALIVGGSVALDVFEVHALYRPHYGEGLCWITSRRALLVLFALPMAILLFVNILLFTVTIFHICALDRITQKALAQNSYSFQTTPPPPSLQRERNRFILCIQLSFIMGLTWVFGFLAALTDLHVLWYVFILFNTAQGAFLCIAFVCNKQVFRLLRRNKDEVAPRQPSSSLNGRVGYSRPTYLFDSEACVIAQETSI